MHFKVHLSIFSLSRLCFIHFYILTDQCVNNTDYKVMRILGVVSLHLTYPLKIKKIDNPLSREFESIYKTASTLFILFFCKF